MKHIISIAAALLLMLACNHKDLCYHHPHTAKVRINADWSLFNKETPSGMTVMLYPQDGKAMRQLTNNTSYALFELPVGLYHTIVFNQSEEEFGSISFMGLEDFSTAEIVTNVADSRWYESRTDNEKVAKQPEWVGTSALTDAEVTQEMIDLTTQELISGGYSRVAPEFVIASHVPQNIVHTIKVKVHLENIYNLRSARASLNGLADSYLIAEGHTTTDKVTQLLESWSLTYDDIDPTKGYITATITSLGLPEDFSGAAEDNDFNLSLLLVDDTTIVNMDFQVGDKWQIKNNEQGNLTLEMELDLWGDKPLPDVQPTDSGDGGFDATVDDWGDEENVDIDI